MMKKRIGNDITFTWHIYRKSGETQTPESFEGKEVEVKLLSPLKQPVTIEDVSIATGVVTFTFKGKHQVTLGNYVAILQENKGEDGMVTLDVVDAVTLVPHSYMEEDGDEGDVIEAEAVELESSISAGGGGGIEQQQADWAQTDDTAVDFIKNKPDLDVYCRKDADNTHSDSVRDIFAKLVYDEHNPSVLMQADRLTVGGDSIKFYHSHRGEAIKELSLQLDDVEKLKNLPTNAELSEVATSGSYNDLSDKPDLSSFITRSVDDLTNYYLKSETYTKNEVLQLIGAIQQFHYEVYPTLPQTGASNVLYLIGPTGSGSDKYEEYVYANNDWTKIGDTSIDLSGYVTTEALTTALADYVTSSALSIALAGKENTANKKTTIAGNEGDDTYYPSTKAVAVYVEEAKKQMLRELYLSTDPRPDSNVNRLRYNDTGADIIRTAEWGERVIHKAGHYWLNGLGDITEDEMSKIYSNGGIINPRSNDAIGNYLSGNYPFRTNLNIAQMNWNSTIQYQFTAMYNKIIRVINLGNNNPQYVNGFRQFGAAMSVCKAIIPALEMSGIKKTDSANNSFYGAKVDQDFMYAMFTKIVIDCPLFKYTPLIMYKCLKYLVDNAGNTSAITVTVHATTYGYLTDSSALPAEHSGVVETPADIATVTNEELVGMKEWDETTKKYVYATKAEWQQIVTDATAKNISFASA